jgi:hypothetical protein
MPDRCERVRWNVLEGIELEEILKSGVRNSIEHFDEYLDDAYVKATRHKIPSPWAAYNMTVSDARTFDPPSYPDPNLCR